MNRSGEHDPLVDLRLDLELELRCGSARAGALDHVDEVAHPLDDLANRVEFETRRGLRQGRKPNADLEVALGPLEQEERLALPGVCPEHEVFHAHDTVEAVETLESALDARGDRPDPLQRAPPRRGWDHCRTPRVPRVGTTPRDVRAVASRSLPVFSQRS